MTSFKEEYLQFEFGSRWEVIKLDEHPGYRQGIEKLDYTKAVDFLALLDGRTLCFFEVKDFRQYRIENQKRMASGELALEWGYKVRDSVACIVGAYRMSDETIWEKCLVTLQDKKQEVKVILWLKYDPPSYHRTRQQVQASVDQNKLKKKFRWLTNKVLVVGLHNNSIPDLNVQNLPRS